MPEGPVDYLMVKTVFGWAGYGRVDDERMRGKSTTGCPRSRPSTRRAAGSTGTARAFVVAEGASSAPSAMVSTNVYCERADCVGGTGICERLSARFSAATPAA